MKRKRKWSWMVVRLGASQWIIVRRPFYTRGTPWTCYGATFARRKDGREVAFAKFGGTNA